MTPMREVTIDDLQERLDELTGLMRIIGRRVCDLDEARPRPRPHLELIPGTGAKRRTKPRGQLRLVGRAS